MNDLVELSFRPKANAKGNQTPICTLSPVASEDELVQYMMHVRARLKLWQANHKDSLLGKNVLYGIKMACNMAFAVESLCKNINDTVVEKCSV